VVRNQDVFPECAKDIDAIEKIFVVNSRSGDEVAQSHFHENDHRLTLNAGFLDELGLGAIQHIECCPRDRSKTSALNDDGLFVEHLGGLDDLSIGGEHGGVGKPEFHQLKAHQAIVYVRESGTRKLDHVDFNPLHGERIEQRRDKLNGIIKIILRRVGQIHPHNAECFLLLEIFVIQHTDMNDDL